MIYLNVTIGEQTDVFCINRPSHPIESIDSIENLDYIEYKEVIAYLKRYLSLSFPATFHIEWCGEAVDETYWFPLTSEEPCELDVWVRSLSRGRRWSATVYHLYDNCGAVHIDSYESEIDAVRHLFVWLLQHDYLPRFPDASIVPDVDTEEDMLERFRQCVEEGTDAMADDLKTVDELFAWCRLLANGSFVRQWTFTIVEEGIRESGNQGIRESR